LFVTPVIYIYLDRFQAWLGRRMPYLVGRGESSELQEEPQ
jgi:hypothetical protein